MEARLESMKVPELKQLLSAAGLTVSGVKADLVKRLLENPAATAGLDGAAPDATATGGQAAAAPEASANGNGAAAPAGGKDEDLIGFEGEAAPAGSAAPAAAAHTTETAAAAPPAKPEPSQTELKAAHIEELQKRLKRLHKFGGSAEEIDDIQKQIERVEKYGVTKETLSVSGVTKLNEGLKEGGRRGERAEKPKAEPKPAAPKADAKPAAPAAPAETVSADPRQDFAMHLDSDHRPLFSSQPEQKAAREAREKADAEAKARRLARFGPVTTDDDKKRKAEEMPSAPEEKKAKA